MGGTRGATTGCPRKAWGPPPPLSPCPRKAPRPQKDGKAPKCPHRVWGGDTVGVSLCHRRDRKATTTVSLRDLGTPPGRPRKALGCPRLTPRVSGDVPCPQRVRGPSPGPCRSGGDAAGLGAASLAAEGLGPSPEVLGPSLEVLGPSPEVLGPTPEVLGLSPEVLGPPPKSFQGRPQVLSFRAVPTSCTDPTPPGVRPPSAPSPTGPGVRGASPQQVPSLTPPPTASWGPQGERDRRRRRGGGATGGLSPCPPPPREKPPAKGRNPPQTGGAPC